MNRDRMLMLLIIGAGAITRLIGLNSRSLWLDEATSLEVASASLLRIVKGTVFDNHTPPFYYIVLKCWLELVGKSETTLRLLSALFDILNIPLVYIFARSLWSVGVHGAIFSAGLYAINPFAIYFAQEGRMYSLLVALSLGTWVATNNWWKKRTIGAALLCAPVITIGFYTHYYFGFFLIGVLVANLLEELRCATESAGGFHRVKIAPTIKKCAVLVLPIVIACLAFVPWLSIVSSLASGSGQQFRKFHTLVLPYTLVRFVLGYAVMPIEAGYKDNIFATVSEHLLVVMLSGISALLLIFLGIRESYRRDPRGSVKALVMIAVAPAISWVIALFIPLLSERYLIVILPVFILLCAEAGRGKFGQIIVGIFILLNLTGVYEYYFNPRFGNADWRGAAAEINKELRAKPAPVVVNPGYVFGVLNFYLQDRHQLIMSSSDHLSNGCVVGKISKCSFSRHFLLIEDGLASSLVSSLEVEGFSVEQRWQSAFDNGIRLFVVSWPGPQ